MPITLNASTSSGLVTTPDNSGAIALQSNGTTQLTVSATGTYGQLKSGTETTTTSGTYVDFTGLPSWVKRITLMINGVSFNGGSSNPTVQLGTSSGIVSSGYKSSAIYIGTSTGGTGSNSGAGFTFYNWSGASNTYDSVVVVSLVGSNTWMCSALFYEESNPGYQTVISGKVALGGTLDRIRFTTVSGADSLDAGSVNILYEG